MKKRLLVSFSGGETSAYMAQWLWNNKQDEYEMIFVFANTGQENQETLDFIMQCEAYFGFPVIWIEGVFHKERGVATSHKVVDFKTATKDDSLFDGFISVYGIPNIANPQCTRELKGQPIISFAKSIGWKNYYTAIGIRIDEFDRMSVQAKKKRFIYPLITMHPMKKPEINRYWAEMPFRLRLKGYQGNCKWCWKKSRPKLLRIAKDNPEYFEVPKRLEAKYGNFMPHHRKMKWIKEGKEVPENITFFRDNTSAIDILEAAKLADPIIPDDSENYTIQTKLDFGSESCEVFSECHNT